MYRVATAEDRPALAALWQQVFGDDTPFVTACLNVFAGPGNVYLAQDEAGGVQAMLLTVPCRIGFTQGVYLYALATLPAARGKGVMSGLMTFAERRALAGGAQFAALIPANVGLFGYYRNRGYTKDIVFRYASRELRPKLVGLADFSRPSPETFFRLRERFITAPYIAFPADRQEMILADLYDSGGGIVRATDGYAVFFRQEDRLLVPELFAEDDTQAENLLGALAEQSGLSKAELTLPQQGGPFAGQGLLRPAALIKPLDYAYAHEEVYLRFALDVVKDSFYG